MYTQESNNILTIEDLCTCDGSNDAAKPFKVTLTNDERKKCLKEIINRLKKILYVYDKGIEDSNYNYKLYCGGILIYVSSSNILFGGELISILVNVNAIIINDFDKTQIKKLVFESINQVEYILSQQSKNKGVE